jgi:hypothetical protein
VHGGGGCPRPKPYVSRLKPRPLPLPPLAPRPRPAILGVKSPHDSNNHRNLWNLACGVLAQDTEIHTASEKRMRYEHVFSLFVNITTWRSGAPCWLSEAHRSTSTGTSCSAWIIVACQMSTSLLNPESNNTPIDLYVVYTQRRQNPSMHCARSVKTLAHGPHVFSTVVAFISSGPAIATKTSNLRY